MAKTWMIMIAFCLVSELSRSQELEPRAYAALPKNLNAVVFAYGFSKGNVLAEPSLPIKDLSISGHTLIGGYVRTFGLFNKLARIQLVTPYVLLSGKAEINGKDTSASRSGFADAKLRFGINLIGTPVLDKKEFTKYTEKTIVGISLVTNIPMGHYRKDKLINIGSNRWAFKPEVGVSKRFRQLYTEVYAGIWFYAVNYDYLGSKKLEQDPVFNMQAHASYFFKNHMMVSVNTTWFDGGSTRVEGVARGDQLDNWRIGGTWAMPVAKGHTLKLQFHIGAFTTSGYDYNAVSCVYQYVF
jgi:hypothetical protein